MIKLAIISVLGAVALMVIGTRLITASIGTVFAIIVFPFYVAFYFLIYLAAFIGIFVEKVKAFVNKPNSKEKKSERRAQHRELERLGRLKKKD